MKKKLSRVLDIHFKEGMFKKPNSISVRGKTVVSKEHKIIFKWYEWRKFEYDIGRYSKNQHFIFKKSFY